MNLSDHIRVAKRYDDSIGIGYIKGKPIVTLPQGCSYENGKDLHKIVKEFLKSINIYKYTTKKNLNIEDQKTMNKQGISFSYEAYSYILDYYINNGVYEEKEYRWEREHNVNKVSWNRTFKYINPIYKNGTPYYLEFINKKNNNKEQSIIKDIFILALNISFKRIGFLYKNIIVPTTNFNSSNYAMKLLKRKLPNINLDSKRLLFKYMIEALSGAKEDNLTQKSFEVKRVEYYWEFLIDKCFNNSNITSKMYAKWKIDNSLIKTSPGRLDTINVQENRINVIDAKYYQYGLALDGNLPGIVDIVKQVAYENFLYDKYNTITRNIFMLPGTLKKDFVKKIGCAEFLENSIEAYIIDFNKLIFALTDRNIKKTFNEQMGFIKL